MAFVQEKLYQQNDKCKIGKDCPVGALTAVQ
jgi:hypothetical protein